MPPTLFKETPEVRRPRELGKPGLTRRIASHRFFAVSIVVHVLIGLFATAWVVQRITTKRTTTFTAATPASRPPTTEHRIQVAKQHKTMSAPAQTTRIVTKGLSKVALPEMPEMPSMNALPSAGRMESTGPMGTVMGAGAPAAGSSGSASTLFGFRDPAGGGLTGTFYDLKQDKSGHPTEMKIVGKFLDPKEKPANGAYIAALTRFVRSGFNASTLSRYYAGRTPLYTKQLFIPAIEADAGPKEFGLEKEVQPRRWVVVYRGTVVPPESGKFRFVGQGDDVLTVRFNGQVVLDAGTTYLSGKKPAKFYNEDGLQKEPPPDPQRNGITRGQLGVGDTITVEAGKSYPMEILIGEHPGGSFKCWLLIEKDGVRLKNDSRGNPVPPIFKLAKSYVRPPTTYAPVFGRDMPWSVWKTGSSTGLGQLALP
jgi:hypothetical protein